MRKMNDSGFTLIELVVVLVIIGILLAIAAISGKALMDRYNVETRIKTMYVDFMNARASAMQKNRMHFVTLTSTQYRIYEDRDPGNPTSPDGDGIFQSTDDGLVMQKDLGQYAMTWNSTSTVEFDTKGLMSGSERTGRVTISYGAAYNCIVISSTRIRMGAWNGTDCIAQ